MLSTRKEQTIPFLQTGRVQQERKGDRVILVIVVSLTDKSLSFFMREEAEKERAFLPGSSERRGVEVGTPRRENSCPYKCV